jgi:hypothetical protein
MIGSIEREGWANLGVFHKKKQGQLVTPIFEPFSDCLSPSAEPNPGFGNLSLANPTIYCSLLYRNAAVSRPSVLEAL